MKKNFILLNLLFSVVLFSQCKISGEENLTKGVPVTYTVDQVKAQCGDCHQWSFSPNNFKFENTKRSSITITPQELGPAEIKVNVFTTDGLKSCSKMVSVKDPSLIKIPTNDDPGICNIETSSFDEIRISPKSYLLYPNVRATSQKYTWEILYSNNTKETIEDIAPIVQEKENLTIISIGLKMKSNTCTKTLTKNFSESVFGKNNLQ